MQQKFKSAFLVIYRSSRLIISKPIKDLKSTHTHTHIKLSLKVPSLQIVLQYYKTYFVALIIKIAWNCHRNK